MNGISPWQSAGQGMQSLGNSMSGIAVGLAQQKMLQQAEQQKRWLMMQNMQLEREKMAQQERTDKQHAVLWEAQSRLANATAKQKEQETTGADALSTASWNLGMVQAEKDAAMPGSGLGTAMRENLARARLMGAVGGMPDSARSELPVNLSQILQMGDPRMQQMLATGTKATEVVPSQSSLVDTLTGMPMFQSPQKLNQGQVMVPAKGGQRIAEGFAPRVGYNTDRTREMATLGNVMNAAMQGYETDTPLFEETQKRFLHLLTTPDAQRLDASHSRFGSKSEQDKETNRAEANRLIQSHPDKADAIRARFKQTYNEDL